ncbi:Shedu immune nuclease family protein [Archangium sp.]|uniref:Shedu immune nuclease family protein n=1 Tax=Archangium sp. TaxID=1872627 RepID=UPI002D726598|nr:Shedu immune nuclease family protein [Archangium sp.]HYO58791.1 Shedu immune nuclease family protein [Archangium sp.]
MLTREQIDALPEGNEAKYTFGRLTWRTYIYQSKEAKFKAASSPDGKPPDEWEAVRVMDVNPNFVWLKSPEVPEVILSEAEPVRAEWRVTFVRSPREIKRVQVQQWGVTNGTPHQNRGISIPVEDIPKLLSLFDFVQNLPEGEITHKARLDDRVMADIVRRVSEDARAAQDFIREYPQLVAALRHAKLDENALLQLLNAGQAEASAMIDAVLRLGGGKAAILRRLEDAGVTEEDIANLTYRKEQLEIFRRLLYDADYFESRLRKLNSERDQREQVWQEFFENNRWVFGYGLKFQWLSGMDDKPLELRLIGGDELEGAGVRMDAVLRSQGKIASLCFVEIKHHLSDLLKKTPYRGEAWVPSEELSGGVAQVQRGVFKVLGREDKQWKRLGVNAPVQPKSILVIGSLSEFADPNGDIDEEKYRSFELFRANVHSPEIITFDELYERCRYIVEAGDDYGDEEGESYDSGDDDIPF